MEPTATVRFASKDGTELHGESYEVPSPRALALVIHGYAEHCGRYRELAGVLADARLSTFAFDLRGHGRAQGPRGHTLRFESYLEDVEAAIAAADGRGAAALPLLLVSHSHGGLIALRLLADPWRCPPRVKAAVLSSPFLRVRLKVPAVKRAAARVLGTLLPSFTMPSGIPIDRLTHDAGKLAERRVDTLCHDVAGARWFNEATTAQEWVHEFAPRVKLPTLWLVAAEDHLVDPAWSRTVFDRLGTAGRWNLLDGLYHEVFNETDRARVFGILRTFVEQMFP
jgi:alpha-beta hydrolase superfamily lysophospholipase